MSNLSTLITKDLKDEIVSDYNRLRVYMGMDDEPIPQINFVSDNINEEACFKLGSCFFDKLKLSFKEFIVTSKGIVSIFTDSVIATCRYLLKTCKLNRVIPLARKLIKYVAIHELTHHLQMKNGLTVGENTEEEIENMCVESTRDFIRQNYRQDKIMNKLVELDLCRLNDMFGDLDQTDERINDMTKREIMKCIAALIDAEYPEDEKDE